MVKTAEATWERLVATLMHAPDPVSAAAQAARNPAVPRTLRAALARINPDGLRMARLLVARLRFERLLRGSRQAAALFDARPEDFAAPFRRYHVEVPARSFFAADEADAWKRWLRRTSRRAGQPRSRSSPRG